ASSESRRTASSRTMGRAWAGVGAEAALAGSARSPVRIRRGFALSVSIGAPAYTRFLTVVHAGRAGGCPRHATGVPRAGASGPEIPFGHGHQRRGTAFDRGLVRQRARQDAGEVEARGLALGVLE